jgi:prephenate dehydratase
MAGIAPESLGVIASASAARRYGLRVLADAVQDLPDNVTQFYILTQPRPANRHAAQEASRW